MFGFEKKMSEEKEMKGFEPLNDEELEEVAGGRAFADIPRVPNKPIDQNLKEKV